MGIFDLCKKKEQPRPFPNQPHIDPQPTVPGKWSVLHSRGTEDDALTISGTGWYLDLPTKPNDVHYVTKKIDTNVLGKTIELEWQVSASSDFLIEDVDPGGGGMLPNFRFIIQRAGDNLGGMPYRWWSNPGHVVIAPGNGVLSVPAQWGLWSGIFPGNDRQADFEDACRNCENIGITFGAGSDFGHGVWVTRGAGRLWVKRFSP